MSLTKPATLSDVAMLAGVSQSAVSRTFTPGASVAPATRERVLQAAAQLGYRPNAIARTLTTRRSRIIGVVVSYLQNQFYPVVIEKLSQALQRHGYHVLLFVSDGHETGATVDDKLMDVMQYQVDALVLASVTLSSAIAQGCRAAGVPVVLFNRTAPIDGVHCVSSDNYAGGRLAAQTLLESGCQRIAYIAGLEDASTQLEREQGFSQQMQEAGIEIFARAQGRYSYEAACEAARELCSKDLRPDGIFAANDHMAMAVMDTLRSELGLKVPQDVAVVGFDNVPQSAWPAYGLTTIEQDAEGMVNATVNVLLQAIESASKNELFTARKITQPVRLIRRTTVKG